MKNNQLKHIPIILLALFVFAISIHNISALAKQKHGGISTAFTVKKRLKSIHAPIKELAFRNEVLFESESENEYKVSFCTALPVLRISQSSVPSFFPAKPRAAIFFDKSSKDLQPQLYLSICSFRI